MSKKVQPLVKEIILEGGLAVTIPLVFRYTKCRGCPADDLIWATTKSGRAIPVRWDEMKHAWITHFQDCKFADRYRKAKNAK